MKLLNLTPTEKQNLLNDMNLFGYFDRTEIEIFFEDEILDEQLIKNVGTYLQTIQKNDNLELLVYNYITNIDNLQEIVRKKMNEKISNFKEMIDYYIIFALDNNLTINNTKIKIVLLNFYNTLYDLAGILEYPCLQIMSNDFSTEYNEQIYWLMLQESQNK